MLFDICQLFFMKDSSGQIQDLKFKKEGTPKQIYWFFEFKTGLFACLFVFISQK